MDIEERLSSVLNEFARTLVTDVPVQGVLDRFVAEIVEVLPAAATRVTTISPDAAASDDTTMQRDRLTGLPNRPLLMQLLDHAMRRGSRSDRLVAVVLAHLEHFESVNATYGRAVGDELLTVVGARLSETFRPSDVIARVGGDEFAILCEDLVDESQAEPLAARVNAIFAAPFAISGLEVLVTASTGVALGGRGDSPERLLHKADAARHRTQSGRTDGGFETAPLDPAEPRTNLNRDLRDALERHELRVDYQPILATADRWITGAEALLRWNHPTLGPIPPETIVLLAEQSGLMTEIGRWVLERSCLDRHRWGSHEHFDISVNVSTEQLMAPGFVALVASVLDETHTDPSLVILEVTETVFIRDSARALVVLNDLKRLGVALALDDFGTGYSSLSYLRQFPVDIVKIDRSFVADVAHERTSRLIVSAIIGLAHGLRINVVAEGIESSEQYDELAALGCESCQGFYFAGPLSVEDLDVLIAKRAGHGHSSSASLLQLAGKRWAGERSAGGTPASNGG